MRNAGKHYSILFLCLMFAGCFGGGESIMVRYYVVDPVDPGIIPFVSDQPLAIEIIDVNIPQYLQRFHMATRIGENRLRFSESNQWGENLRKNLMRTMALNLSALLSTTDVSTPLNRSSSLPDYRIHIHIDQFEQDSDGNVKLLARWQLSDDMDSAPLGVYSADLESPEVVAQGDYDQMVSIMQDLYGQLSGKIAETVISAEAN